jgi:uncharacterized protein (TIGR03437 family)
VKTHNKIALGATLIVASVALISAYSTGPDPRYTGAPGDSPDACASLGCHVGTALNGGGGNVVVNFSDGLTYSPGVQQTFTIVIADSSARLYGFQMTARLESNLESGQAGDFTSTPDQFVICENSSIKGANGCPGNFPIQFIEHNHPYSTNTISVRWTPPSSDVGDIRIYVAANAANGDANNTDDHIYAANYKLTPRAAGGSPPNIDSVVSASAFNVDAGLASGTWLEIYGANLSSTTRSWAAGDFHGSNAPTALDGVTVSIGGLPAYVDYVSPGQVNVQAPDDPSTGAGIQVVLKNSGVESNAVSMQKNAIAPALLAPPSFKVQGRQFVLAQFSDLTFAGTPGLIQGLNFRLPKPGDVLTIYGIGFGPVTPATAAGVIAPSSNSLVSKPNFRFGQTAAQLLYYGLVPGFVGLYQFNVAVPNVSAGDMPLNVDAAGVTLNQSLFISVGQ